MTTRRFHRVAVLMGGVSAEREVSLASGTAVLNGLREAGYDVVGVDVKTREAAIPAGVEAVFIALHGEFGEDGEVQALLDRRGIPYTGSGAKASHAAFDKAISKRILAEHGIPTPAYELLRQGDRRGLPLPVVTKPICQGSSIGVHRVPRESDWDAAIRDTLAYGPEAMIEAYVDGRELTVGVVGEEALPVIEIEVPGGWYDYGAKYTKGKSLHHVPAPIETEVARRCQALAVSAFQVLGCRGMGRVDFRLSTAGELFVLELNNIPGFTATSLLPDAAASAGIRFPELCDRIISLATTG